jgi:hypothetical protein
MKAFLLYEGNMAFPCAICPTRYGGVYEGGKWAAFGCDPWEVPSEAFGDDIACGVWWAHDKPMVTATGSTPEEAHANLVEELKAVEAQRK